MPTASAADWLILGLSLLGFCGFAATAWWALASDRGRRRRRCPRCWFDMTYTQGRRCSECGHVASSEEALHRRRRRPLVGLLSVLGCAILGARGLDHVIVGGWGQYLPTPALVAMLDHGTPGVREADAELRRRARTDRLSDATWQRLLAGAADGSRGAAVGTDAWIGRHGRWVMEAWGRLTAGEDAATAAEATETVLRLAAQYPPEIELEPPDRWPADRPVPVGVVVREPWDVPLPMRLVAHPEAGPVAAFARFGPPIQRRSFTIDLAAMPPGRHAVPIRFEMARALARGGAWTDGAGVEATARFETVPPEGPPNGVTGTGDLPAAEADAVANAAARDARDREAPPPGRDASEETDRTSPGDGVAGMSPDGDSGAGSDGIAPIGGWPPGAWPPAARDEPPERRTAGRLEPVDVPGMAERIADVFDRGAIQWEYGSLPLRITVNRSRTAIPRLGPGGRWPAVPGDTAGPEPIDFEGVAIGIEVEVRRNGRLGRTLELWWLGGVPQTTPPAWDVPFVDDSVLAPPTTPEDVWELVIRGREDLALRVPGARRWWSGQFTRPLTVRRRAGGAPSRGWVPVPPPESSESEEPASVETAARSENPRSPAAEARADVRHGEPAGRADDGEASGR